MKKMPLGIQSFEKIRTDLYLYIDKTQLAFAMAEQGTYYFLSRPRRFGKSLFLDIHLRHRHPLLEFYLCTSILYRTIH